MSKYKPYIDQILLGHDEEREVSMLFDDGIAVEVDNEGNILPYGHILTYPLIGDVLASEEMMRQVREYCGRADYVPYDIALKFGLEYNLAKMQMEQASKWKTKAWLVIIDDWNAEVDIVKTSDEELSEYDDTEAFLVERLQYDLSHIHWVLCNEDPKINHLTSDDYEDNREPILDDDWDEE